ncbi:MAG: HlyD family efflux transporter periplasmic adaptor subunit [Novosphingobium sp.]
MKLNPKVIAAALLVAAAAIALWLLWSQARDERWLGYVEGETLYIAAPVPGRLAARPVERGARVAAGAPLFALDGETADADLARLSAQVSANEAQVEDLGQARQRQADLDVARAGEAVAAAQLARTQRDFDRVSALSGEGIVSRAQLDAARAARDAAQATLAQARAQIRSGELSAGRQGQIASAQAGVAGAEAALRAQRKLRSEIAPVSPAGGVIEQVFFNPGEWVPANSPVVAVLPDDKRKLRFFVPQDRIAALHPGMTVRFTCDGCGAERQARVSYIAPRSEYAPPVIYSERARAKLVFLVEAALPASDKPLPPGLPVEIVPVEVAAR